MYIYKTTNKINGKIYIGLTTMKIEESQWYLGSGDSIKKAIEKYGFGNFEKEVLESGFKTKEDLVKSEIKWIEYFNSTNRKIGYNLSPGGDLNPGHIKKSICQYHPDGKLIKLFTCIDDAIKDLQMKNSDIYKKSIRESRPIKGFWWSLEEKSVEEIVCMHQRYLEEKKNKVSEGNKKRYLNPKYLEEQKEHMRKIQKTTKPKPMTLETKKKISESIRGKKWYTNTITGMMTQSRVIPDGEGWILGRKKINPYI